MRGDLLATAFQHLAAGRGTAKDHEQVAAVLRNARRGAHVPDDLVDAAARRYGSALAAALAGGSDPRSTLQAFLDILEVGRLLDPPLSGAFEPNDEVHPAMVRLARAALRIALEPGAVSPRPA